MKKLFFIVIMATAIGSGVGLFSLTQNTKEADMAYCTIADLQAAYGEDRIAGWSRLDADTVDRTITDAGAEIDGYLFSRGYAVPLPGTSANIKKYAVDIACASLVLSAGMLEANPGGKAIYERRGENEWG
jgi:hypothetical protein